MRKIEFTWKTKTETERKIEEYKSSQFNGGLFQPKWL